MKLHCWLELECYCQNLVHSVTGQESMKEVYVGSVINWKVRYLNTAQMIQIHNKTGRAMWCEHMKMRNNSG